MAYLSAPSPGKWISAIFRENCFSTIRVGCDEKDYNQVVYKLLAVLFGMDRVVFQFRKSVGVRLEDLKAKPEATMEALGAAPQTPSLVVGSVDELAR